MIGEENAGGIFSFLDIAGVFELATSFQNPTCFSRNRRGHGSSFLWLHENAAFL
jgi:hypothetical protein